MFISLVYYFYFLRNNFFFQTFLAHHADLRLLNYNKQDWKQNSTTKVIEINTEEELLKNNPRAEPLKIKTSTISLIPTPFVIKILGSVNYILIGLTWRSARLHLELYTGWCKKLLIIGKNLSFSQKKKIKNNWWFLNMVIKCNVWYPLDSSNTLDVSNTIQWKMILYWCGAWQFKIYITL